ncbi:MAG: hypothetical protein JSU77_09020 [Fidelibacterota bacterium]|nr:MAG: hypothetical protein JSU77_09020 [Candidatus Neomarinimicrobiota bacterium]
MTDLSSQLLFHILQSEQTILTRTDQKAYTLLSIPSVFIVCFRMMVITVFIVVILAAYFGLAFIKEGLESLSI